MRVEYRYSGGQRVAHLVVGIMQLLIFAFVVVIGIMTFVNPAAIDSPGQPVNTGNVLFVVIVFSVAGLFAYGGVKLLWSMIADRLVVTSEGLVSRRVGWIRVRVTTIAWSWVTSFTVKDVGPRDVYRQVVHAILDSGQQVKLSATARRRAADAAAIAGELTAMLRQHHNDSAQTSSSIRPEGSQ